MSAWVSQNHLVLGRTRTAADSNKITEIPKLLSILELPGVAWSCLELPGVAWSCLELPGVAWSCLELPGVAWSCLELPGVAWSCLELPGRIITIDAMGCQEDIARQIVDGGSDYPLAVKSNQGELYGNIKDVFECAAR